MTITQIYAREILDSRGLPTISCTVTVDTGNSFTAIVPAGGSVGKREAGEFRDGDPHRYNGKGVLKAVHLINDTLFKLLKNKKIDLFELDFLLLAYDGTPDKSNCGANVLLALSMAFARAQAYYEKKELYGAISDWLGVTSIIPTPLFNLINGGRHAYGSCGFQEYMLFSHKKQESFAQLLSQIFTITRTLEKKALERKLLLGIGDEGGFVLRSLEQELQSSDLLDLLGEALSFAGFSDDYSFALDAATEQLYDQAQDSYLIAHKRYSSQELLVLYKELCGRYPLKIIEDPFVGEHAAAWRELLKFQGFQNQAKVQKNSLVVGDDLTVTQSSLIELAAEDRLINAVIIKPNQIGTVTEALQAVRVARARALSVIVSHRSGESCDAFIADFAVGVAADYVKFGACQRSERLAKYNRLLEIAVQIDI